MSSLKEAWEITLTNGTETTIGVIYDDSFTAVVKLAEKHATARGERWRVRGLVYKGEMLSELEEA